jgi:sporulation protein YabP
MENGATSLKLTDRESLIVSGVHDILSFTDQKICVHTFDGVLTVLGKQLKIKRFGTEDAAEITGRINSLSFSEGALTAKSFLSKLVK